jgi:hypothetical protein
MEQKENDNSNAKKGSGMRNDGRRRTTTREKVENI